MKRMEMLLVVMVFALMILAFDRVVANADSHTPAIEREKYINAQPVEYHSMIATAYCLKGKTATGTQTRPGIAASKREWFGKKCRVYLNDNGEPGQLVGEYTIEDTGGRPIRNGSVIDVWLPTEDECFQFGSKCVLIEILE